MTRIDICVCTFRRAVLSDALRSIRALEPPDGVDIRVLVVDNDETPSARPLAEIERAVSPFRIDYLHRPFGNISVARNGALEASGADWIAFLDDDEIVTPGWLAALLDRARESGADVVLGPVRALYGTEAPAWMRAGDFHSTLPTLVRGEILTGYSCNVLFRRDAPTLRGLRFRPDLGRSGGEDTEFFDRARRTGARIAYAPDALAWEPVPRDRARLSWLLVRRFRSGQSHGTLLLSRNASRRGVLGGGAAAATKSAASLAAAAATAWDRRRSAFWLLRAALHAGVIARLLGRRELQLYG